MRINARVKTATSPTLFSFLFGKNLFVIIQTLAEDTVCANPHL